MVNVTNKSKIVNGVQHKQCGKCKRYKPLDEFNKFKRGSLGVATECKKCSIKRTVEWIGHHPEYFKNHRLSIRNKYKNDSEFREWKKQKDRERRINNLEYFREYQRMFRKKNPDYYRNLYAKKKVDKNEMHGV